MGVENNQTYFFVMHFISLLRLYSTECLVNSELKGCGRKRTMAQFQAEIIVFVWRDRWKPYETNVQKQILLDFMTWQVLYKLEFSIHVVNCILQPTGNWSTAVWPIPLSVSLSSSSSSLLPPSSQRTLIIARKKFAHILTRPVISFLTLLKFHKSENVYLESAEIMECP